MKDFAPAPARKSDASSAVSSTFATAFAPRLAVPATPPPRPAHTTVPVPRVQFKLAVSQPDDPLEREADRVADAVLRTPAVAVPPRPPRSLAALAAPCQPADDDRSRRRAQDRS